MPEYKNIMASVFPELAESKDERIREAILTGLIDCRDAPDLGWSDFGGINIDECITWLEKQGKQKPYGQRKECEDCQFNYAGECKGYCQMKKDEQEPVDEVEPKFKAGNWYQCTKDFFGKGVTFDKNTAYYCAQEGCLQNKYGCHIAIVKDLYDNFKLWTIADAKDGDVLYSPCLSLLWIFKSKDTIYCGCNLNYNDGAFCGEGYFERPTDAIPATKEQRDTLIKAMANAGYTFDFEKKGLKKIESKTLDADKAIEWIKHYNITDCDMRTSIIPDSSPTSIPHRVRWFSEDFIDKFKKDFGLC